MVAEIPLSLIMGTMLIITIITGTPPIPWQITRLRVIMDQDQQIVRVVALLHQQDLRVGRVVLLRQHVHPHLPQHASQMQEVMAHQKHLPQIILLLPGHQHPIRWGHPAPGPEAVVMVAAIVEAE
jgi:hypothetical protein